MATTTTTTSFAFVPRPRTAPVPTGPTVPPSSPPCASCGSPSPPETELEALQRAQQRVEELESQVKILTLRATSAVEKANEYEHELRRVSNAAARSPPLMSPRSFSAAVDGSPNHNIAAVSPPASPPRSAANRLVRLLSTRSASTVSLPLRSGSPVAPGLPRPATGDGQLPPPAPPPPKDAMAQGWGSPDAALRDALSQEQALRREAESQEQALRREAKTLAARKDSEVEELTAQLFEQANEMVATERRAKAKLESRVEVLEKRDNDKAKRLGLLEARVQRAERVRALLFARAKLEDSDDCSEKGERELGDSDDERSRAVSPTS